VLINKRNKLVNPTAPKGNVLFAILPVILMKPKKTRFYFLAVIDVLFGVFWTELKAQAEKV